MKDVFFSNLNFVHKQEVVFHKPEQINSNMVKSF